MPRGSKTKKGKVPLCRKKLCRENRERLAEANAELQRLGTGESYAHQRLSVEPVTTTVSTECSACKVREREERRIAVQIKTTDELYRTNDTLITKNKELIEENAQMQKQIDQSALDQIQTGYTQELMDSAIEKSTEKIKSAYSERITQLKKELTIHKQKTTEAEAKAQESNNDRSALRARLSHEQERVERVEMDLNEAQLQVMQLKEELEKSRENVQRLREQRAVMGTILSYARNGFEFAPRETKTKRPKLSDERDHTLNSSNDDSIFASDECRPSEYIRAQDLYAVGDRLTKLIDPPVSPLKEQSNSS